MTYNSFYENFIQNRLFSSSYEVVGQMFVRLDDVREKIQILGDNRQNLFFITLKDLKYQIENKNEIIHIDPLVNEIGKNPQKYSDLYKYFIYVKNKLYQVRKFFSDDKIYMTSLTSYDSLYQIYQKHSQSANSDQHILLFFLFNGGIKRSTYKQDISYNIQNYSRTKQFNLRAFISKETKDNEPVYELFMKFELDWYQIKGSSKILNRNFKFFLEKAEILVYLVDRKYEPIPTQSSLAKSNPDSKSKSNETSLNSAVTENNFDFVFSFTNIIKYCHYKESTTLFDLKACLKSNLDSTLADIINEIKKRIEGFDNEYSFSFYCLHENRKKQNLFKKITKDMTLRNLRENGYLETEKNLSLKIDIPDKTMQTILFVNCDIKKYILMYFHQNKITKKDFITYINYFLKENYELQIEQAKDDLVYVHINKNRPLVVSVKK